MAVHYRSANAQLAAVVQVSAGTEGSPNPASDAVRVAGDHPIGYGPEFNRVDTSYANASVSLSAPSIALGKGTMKLAAYLTGSTVPGNAADPDYGKLLQGCGMVESKFAGQSGTAQGGSSSTIILKAAASAVDGAYVGMPVFLTGGGGASVVPNYRVVTAYNGTTKVATVAPNWGAVDATTTYSIPANTLWSPITASLPLLTLWGYIHHSQSGGLSKRRRLFDAMGSCVLTGKPRGVLNMAFDFVGRIPAIPDDVARPSAPAPLGTDPQALQNGVAYLGNGPQLSKRIKFTDWTVDFGNDTRQFDDPWGVYGYDSAEIVRRATKGSLNLNLNDSATRDNWTIASPPLTTEPLWISWGTSGVNGVLVYHPAIRITNIGPGNSNGWQSEKIDYDCTGVDSETYICVY
jgi:hypothetical protein